MGVPRTQSMPHILSVAEQVFAASGFAGTSMAEIARAAQLPKANIHYYFGTKDALYRAVLETILTGWLADAENWIAPHRSPREALNGYIRAKLAFSRARPAASRLFAHEVLGGAGVIRPYLETTLRDHVAMLGRTLTHWAEQGLMPKVDPPHFMVSLWAMTQAYADMQPQICAILGVSTLRTLDFDRAANQILQLVLGQAQHEAG